MSNPPADQEFRICRRDGVALLLLLLVSLVILGIGFWSRYNLYRLDVITFYLPWYEHLGERLRDGDVPGWIPYTMSGTRFAGDPQSGWGYLPAMAIFTIAPSLAGYVAFVAFHVGLAAITSYLYARIIGINPIGSFAAGVVFTLGNFLYRVACCTVHMQVAVWIPAIFLCYELGRQARSTATRFGWLAATGFCTGQMISGWVGQGAYYGALLVTGYLVYRSILGSRDKAPAAQRIRGLLVAAAMIAIVGAATAAPAVLPRLETVNRSNLSDLYEDDSDGDAHFWAIQAVPHRLSSYDPSEMRSYLGAAPIAAVLLASCLAIRRRHASFFLAAGAVVFGLIVRDSPLIDLFNLLPRFRSLHGHSPDRLLIILPIVLAVLIGWLVHTVTDPRWRGRDHPIALTVAVLVTVSALIGSVPAIERWSGEAVPILQIWLAASVVVVVVTMALVRVRLVVALGTLTIVLLLLYDPSGRFAAALVESDSRQRRMTRTVSRLTTPNEAARWLQDRSSNGEIFRYFGYDQDQLMLNGRRRTYHVKYGDSSTVRILVNNRGVPLELEDVQGYNPVQSSAYVELLGNINTTGQSYHAANILASGLDSPLLNLLNIRYIVLPADIPPVRPDLLHIVQRWPTVHLDRQSRILENPRAQPRAWIVHEAQQKDDREEILVTFSLNLADPAKIAFVTTEPPALESATQPGSESVEVLSYEPDEISLEATVQSTGMVVLSELWDPDWSATVGGETVEVLQVNGLFRGIVLTPGTHEIVLKYEASTARASLLFYLVPLAALALIPLIDKRHSGSRRRPLP